MSEDPLRKRFEELRRSEAESAPAFEHTLARARARSDESRRSRAPWWVLAAAGSALAVAFALFLMPGRSVAPEFRPGNWATPSDALLLDLPGASILSEVPAFPDYDATDRPRYTL